ncbi:MAG: 16S rRNA (guanine(527)-N(7))-methyltransferase RsmG [Bacillota bacterium]|jgi:16S rRNA (guanine527-N7)-methyltransferase
MTGSENLGGLLREGCDSIGLKIKEGQISQYLFYLELVQEWNKKVNLTSIVDEKEIIIKHFIDSLMGAPLLGDQGRLVDVGSGAGFPGLVLKIFYPEMEVCLVESVKKKARFLGTAVLALELKGVQVLSLRAEEIGRDISFRESFDYAVCRAVSELAVIAEYCLPLVKVGGYFVAYKGEMVEEELSRAAGAFRCLGGEVGSLRKGKLPFLGDGRTLVQIKKTCPCPGKYPRRPGIPAKRPLKE